LRIGQLKLLTGKIAHVTVRVPWLLTVPFIAFLLLGFAFGSSWTEGHKTLLYIRIDFTDLPGDPVETSKIKSTLSRVEAYFRDNSYGDLVIQSTTTPTLRMPHPASFYEGNLDQQQVINDARAAAKIAGFDTQCFTFDIVAFRTLRGGDSELAVIGGKGARILNNFRYGITIHAIGHNLGLPHSRFWRTTDGSIIGTGEAEEYGDVYDPMGGGGNEDAIRNHLIIRSKAILGWLGQSGLTNVTSSGLYRLFPQDLAMSGCRGLHIDRDSHTEYWVEFRQLIIDNPRMMNGIRLLRSDKDRGTVDLLSMNPGSPDGASDAPLLLGHTFSDAEAGIFITPFVLRKTQVPSMDVFVKLGKRPPNGPISLRLKSATENGEVNQPLEFIAQVSNPSRASLIYAWDFGDGTFECSTQPKASHAWTTDNRDFLVRSYVTDLWGQEAAASKGIMIGHSQTQRLSGAVTDGDRPLTGVRLNIAPAYEPTGELLFETKLMGPRSILDDDDGQFLFIGLSDRGTYMVRASKPGYFILPFKSTCPSTKPLKFNAVKLNSASSVSSSQNLIRLHVHARIDGHDELWISRRQANWRHLSWEWPTNIELNNVSMDPHKTLANTGENAFLPANVNLESAVMTKKSGRGALDLYRQDESLVVVFDDPQPGADDYEMDIEFYAVQSGQ
jgi:hypothetical protein